MTPVNSASVEALRGSLSAVRRFWGRGRIFLGKALMGASEGPNADQTSIPSVFKLLFASRTYFLALNRVCVFLERGREKRGIGRPALATAKVGPCASCIPVGRSVALRPIWSRGNRQIVDHSLRGCSCPLRPRLDLSDCGWAMVAPIGNPDHLAANV